MPNPIGTAPGFSVRVGRATAFFMPGVPREMTRMFDEQVTPRIREIAPNDTHQIRLQTFGLPESVVGEKLAGVEAAHAGVVIGYRAHFPEIEVKVLAKARVAGVGARRVREGDGRRARAPRRRRSTARATTRSRRSSGACCATSSFTLAIAESCTGGLVGSMLTREPGASDFLLLDAVTYANTAKARVLGVDEDVLRAHGAVSSEVAAAMAEGARRTVSADVALSLTGIAGPTGGTDTKPVGTVFLAVTGARGTEVKHRVFSGERWQIQTIAAYAGLELVRRYVSA